MQKSFCGYALRRPVSDSPAKRVETRFSSKSSNNNSFLTPPSSNEYPALKAKAAGNHDIVRKQPRIRFFAGNLSAEECVKNKKLFEHFEKMRVSFCLAFEDATGRREKT